MLLLTWIIACPRHRFIAIPCPCRCRVLIPCPRLVFSSSRRRCPTSSFRRCPESQRAVLGRT
ncbi:uncharacterized protein LACBIDRAFT_299542 [Laccaria bicolor S238N-H82]|uniref:Predicted protein n=1 Tax=Laccaria bicolor (strain S238N-H82 / ATCC MYA-4686) TaxID=486041 RepID=B0DKX7_LACBS|nr:uncharacterized protein LACBIDRAFT_304087 [Laccaria bicolor S238N-H82]XP_001890838.1 uncharacterized protein LACBIDRAFT_299542 [Laccaria bicolor S238N-H82]EDQ98508.1 predicted protein [Laccaria bicolor S238N-H82]EDR04724.1 predicted protein [Laccaria bicolor S238N-H82]|eukprot:XP_001884548.1 predicted protein [Laccaria bicolor S238N-H82]